MLRPSHEFLRARHASEPAGPQRVFIHTHTSGEVSLWRCGRLDREDIDKTMRFEACCFSQSAPSPPAVYFSILLGAFLFAAVCRRSVLQTTRPARILFGILPSVSLPWAKSGVCVGVGGEGRCLFYSAVHYTGPIRYYLIWPRSFLLPLAAGWGGRGGDWLRAAVCVC